VVGCPAVLVELTTFRLADGVDEAAFLAADAEVQAELSPEPGFVRRTTARGDDGTWLVLAMWWSAGHADEAPPPVPTDLVDEGSLRRERYTTLD
jgi:hypothetical protein